MSKKYKIGDVTFASLGDKQVWILNGVKHSLEYIGKETNISKTEDELRKLSIKDINKVINLIKKNS